MHVERIHEYIITLSYREADQLMHILGGLTAKGVDTAVHRIAPLFTVDRMITEAIYESLRESLDAID